MDDTQRIIEALNRAYGKVTDPDDVKDRSTVASLVAGSIESPEILALTTKFSQSSEAAAKYEERLLEKFKASGSISFQYDNEHKVTGVILEEIGGKKDTKLELGPEDEDTQKLITAMNEKRSFRLQLGGAVVQANAGKAVTKDDLRHVVDALGDLERLGELKEYHDKAGPKTGRNAVASPKVLSAEELGKRAKQVGELLGVPVQIKDGAAVISFDFEGGAAAADRASSKVAELRTEAGISREQLPITLQQTRNENLGGFFIDLSKFTPEIGDALLRQKDKFQAAMRSEMPEEQERSQSKSGKSTWSLPERPITSEALAALPSADKRTSVIPTEVPQVPGGGGKRSIA